MFSFVLNPSVQLEPTHVVTLPIDGAYQPVYPEFAFQNHTSDFWAFTCTHVVDVYTRLIQADGSEAFTTFHGMWTDETGPRRFGASASDKFVVRQVEPYLYHPVAGRLDAWQAHGWEINARTVDGYK